MHWGLGQAEVEAGVGVLQERGHDRETWTGCKVSGEIECPIEAMLDALGLLSAREGRQNGSTVLVWSLCRHLRTRV